MQIDLHFYGVYALARAAGLDPVVARQIAYSSQFVDDAIEDDHALIANRRAIVPTMTSHRPLDYRNALAGEQWKVWIPFHFLPGDDPGTDTFVERMVTLPGSEPAKRMLAETLKEKNRQYCPHLIGIAAHVLADTYSHFGFVGFASEWNRVHHGRIRILNLGSRSSILKYVRGKLEEFKARFLSPVVEMVPVGHGAVATLPDRPYLEWSFRYQTHPGKASFIRRDNATHYATACRHLHEYLSEYAGLAAGGSGVPGRPWSTIQPTVKSLLARKKPVDDRIQAWKKAITAGKFCDVTPADVTVTYDDREWLPWNARNSRQVDEEPQEMDACCYIRAAHRYRAYVLHELFPALGLVIS